MKHAIYKKIITFASITLFSATATAFDPMSGLYGGLLIGVNYTPAFKNFPFVSPVDGTTETGIITYSTLGQLGGQVGYRIQHFRMEGEVAYNSSPYNKLLLSEITVTSFTDGTGLNFQGHTNTLAAMFNVFYDFYAIGYTDHIVPYIGGGVGYALVDNGITFYLDGTKLTPADVYPDINGNAVVHPNASEHTGNVAAQAILGCSYFLDDFASLSLDVRYLSTIHNNNLSATENIQGDMIRGSVPFYSINLIFNGAFDLG